MSPTDIGPQHRRLRRRRRIMCFASALAVGLMVFWQRDFGRVDRLRARLHLKGEAFTLEELNLPQTEATDPVLEIVRLVASACSELVRTGQADPEAVQGVERPHVGWRQPRLLSSRGVGVKWEEAEAAADALNPELAPLHAALHGLPGPDDPLPLAVLKEVPSGGNTDLRVVAQSLSDLTLIELHRGRHEAAMTNLVSLLRMVEQDRTRFTLVGTMVRTVLAGLAIDVVWEALQSPGWTDAELAQLGGELRRLELRRNMPRVYEVERVGMLAEFKALREGGLSYVQNLSRQLGGTLPSLGKQRIYFGYWRGFESRRTEEHCIRNMQWFIDRERALATGMPYNDWHSQPPSYPLPLPTRWLSQWVEPPTGWCALTSLSRTPNFVRATEAVLRTEAARRVAVTAVAVERYSLAKGRHPNRLADLKPEFVFASEVSPFDGRQLTYRLSPTGRYSIGAPESGTVDSPPRGMDAYWVPGCKEKEEDIAGGEPEVSDEVLPLICFNDAPCADVLMVLARQAGFELALGEAINYALADPVSLRLENVTAANVLDAVLANRGLVRKRNVFTGINWVVCGR